MSKRISKKRASPDSAVLVRQLDAVVCQLDRLESKCRSKQSSGLAEVKCAKRRTLRLRQRVLRARHRHEVNWVACTGAVLWIGRLAKELCSLLFCFLTRWVTYGCGFNHKAPSYGRWRFAA